MDITSLLSTEQKAILQVAVTAGEYRGPTSTARNKIAKLHAHGLVQRHETDTSLCFPTDAGRAAAVALGLAEPPAVSTPVLIPPVRASVPEMVSMLQMSARLFDEGDVARAHVIADGVYDLSQAEARFAAKYEASKMLVPKFRQLQGDALLMETRCKIELARAYDKAQETGTAAKRGRPKNVASDDIFKQAEAGLTRQEIHDARKLAAAEEKTPGIAERAIAARIAQGFAPTRANLKAAIGTKKRTKAEQGVQLHETPAEAMYTLLALEDFSPVVFEPCCGRGSISRLLEAAGHDVILSDLVDYGTTDRFGEVQRVSNFLDVNEPVAADVPDIVSNFPFGDVLNGLVAHALRVHRPGKMALLMNLNVLAGFDDPDRTYFMEECPPSRIYVFKRRLPMMHQDGWDGEKATSQMNTMWCVWEAAEDGTYGNQTIVKRVDWQDYQPDTAEVVDAESEAA